MAFVARCGNDGKVVDRQPLSWRSSVPISDVSDEEETGSMTGYTNRTFGAPTVRFVGQGEVDNEEGCVLESQKLQVKAVSRFKVKQVEETDLSFEEEAADASGDDTESIMSFCKQLDKEEAYDAMYKFTDEHGHNIEYLHEDKDVFFKSEDAAATDTETLMNINEDLQSLSSFNSLTPTVTDEAQELGDDDTDVEDQNLDNLSNRTYFISNVSMESLPLPLVSSDCRSEIDQGQMSSRTYDLSNCGSNRIQDNSSVSTCSWTDMYGPSLQTSDNRSNIIPALSLTSVDSDTSTFFKNLEEVKERQGQAAFDSWKARKEEQKQQKLLAAMKERKKREAEAALRQQLSQEKFQEWVRRKKEQQQKKPPNNKKSPSSRKPGTSPLMSGNTSTTSSVTRLGSSSTAARKVEPVPPELVKKSLKDWERIKLEQKLRDRERQRKLEEYKQKQEEERKARSQGAWNKWMKQVDKRAKPVPLNQGFDSLRGTISNIYINPVPWVSNIDLQKTGRSH
ncbi:hypothetical protein KR018_000386 [Drosophila ironensis]|nr:hypothetical protein KR018_000386 [Drosophila ironensis]